MKPLAGGVIGDASIAIRYLLEFPDIVIIPGIERIGEIEEIMDIVNSQTALSDAEREIMDRIRQELRQRFCHRCDYCQPCPQSIPISRVMAYPSMFKRMPPRFLSVLLRMLWKKRPLIRNVEAVRKSVRIICLSGSC